MNLKENRREVRLFQGEADRDLGHGDPHMNGEPSVALTEKEQSEIRRNLAEEQKFLQEAAEIGTRLKYRWLRVGLAGAASGIAVFLFVFNNFLPLLKRDLEIARREKVMADLQLSEAEVSRRKAEAELVALKAASEAERHNKIALQNESKALRAELLNVEQSLEQGKIFIGTLNRQIEQSRRESRDSKQAQLRTSQEKERVEQEKAKVEQTLRTTQESVDQISGKLAELEREREENLKKATALRRCREFDVIQRSSFPIPGLDYKLSLGDMSRRRLVSLVVQGPSFSEQFRDIKVNEERIVRNGNTELSLTFLTIEANGLLPGISEDSGRVKICTDSWKVD